jgi:pimeloyl-ACP methyl ester carboxylesterase
MRCNLSAQQYQQVFGASCEPVHNSAITTMASDWDDIDAVVNYLLRRTNVERVHLVGWSQGGPRTGGYAARHPDKVATLVQLAPAYFRESPATPSAALLAGPVMTKQSRSDFMDGWNRQVGCENQYDPAVASVIFDEMLASDPVGATWGEGVRRAPRVPTFGWTPQAVAAMQTPLLMVAGAQDVQITPDRVAALYDDYGGRKLLLEMPCASHNAMWEKDAEVLFEASYQWLTRGSYLGRNSGRLTQP